MSSDFDPYQERDVDANDELKQAVGANLSLKEQQTAFSNVDRRFKLFTLYSTACSLVSAIIATVLYIRTRDIPDVPTCSASVVFWLLLTIAIVEGISSIIGVASMLAYLYTIVKPDATSIDNYQKQTFSGVLILRMVTSLGVGVLAIVLGSFVWNGSCYYSSPDIWTEGTIFLAFIWVIQITLPVIVLSILYQLFKK